ncbi:CheR family methyltransferase [Catalinimonas niigatensis]|uniref:CheR family methyltransferase n=1 Tax=Catalinimonas niigatensis TaxID=1397264 RepID=UPI002665964C|nr:CheR family methyltransferase [Catalinimonas niigatensis]WPP48861.1 CheR family methyltransferase [Catalinimonas niigatensis]
MDKFHVVGMGSSAGGYEAIKLILKNLSGKPDMAFLIIQHISQQHTAMSVEMIAQHTLLPVCEASDGMPVKNNTVYLMPLDRSLCLDGYTFHINRNNSHVALTHAVDTVLVSMAHNFEDKAIGIILSGKGTDGSRGIRSIAEAGGLVMVQSPDTAEFTNMPQVAISTGYADLVMSPEEIAAKMPDIIQRRESKPTSEKPVNISSEIEDIQNIIELLSQYSEVNFSLYKINSIVRRIEKRMALTDHERAEEYYNYLKSNKNELNTLYKKSLIGVTDFFRDPEAFTSFAQNVVPQLCDSKDQYEQLRIWVPACSTGEEAYTIAILLEEYIRDHQLKLDYKLFATDLDQSALEFASLGRYPEEAIKRVSQERVNRFFQQEGAFYSIDPHIRKKILFVKHNLLKDPPFIRLDVVSCRNLFIYLKPEAQRRVTGVFHYALKTKGFFMLGANEYLEETEAGFEKVDGKNRIYLNLSSANHLPHNLDNGLTIPAHQHYKTVMPREEKRLPADELHENIATLLLEVYVPTSVVVNQHLEVIYLHGEVGKYMQLPQKRVSFDLSKMVAPYLLPIMKSGIKKLRDGQHSVLYKDVPREKDGESIPLTNINFKRLGSQQDQPLFLIEFGNLPQDSSMAVKVGEIRSEDFSNEYIADLEGELNNTKQELMAVSQELEANREELQASNEEMLSSNEELQSTNEELQSSNEELYSVNSELKRKIEELTTLNYDINNLFESTDIAIAFLDEKLNIRKFTPSVAMQFRIRSTDIGRPLSDLNKKFEDKNFEKDLLQVLETGELIEKEARNQNGRSYMLRITPYREDDESGSGLVIVFVDITELRRANEQLMELTRELQSSEANKKSLLDNTPDVIIRYDRDLKHLFVSNSAKNVFHREVEKSKGFDDYEVKLFEEKEATRLREKLLHVIDTGRPDEFYTSIASGQSEIHLYVKLVAEFDDKKKDVQSVLAIARDITSLKKAELELQNKNQELERINKYLDEFVFAIAHDLRAPVASLLSIVSLFKEADSNRKIELNKLLTRAVHQLDFTLNGLVDMIDAQEEGSQQRVYCQFSEVLEDIKNELHPALKKSEAVIEDDFEQVRGTIYNKSYLYSIIRNLISNAVKYRSDQRLPCIKLQTQAADHSVLLRVSDNGRGINLAQHRGELFKPFKRFDENTAGKGIGLHIIKNMVERNGGKIEVDSIVEEGSTFSVYLKEY